MKTVLYFSILLAVLSGCWNDEKDNNNENDFKPTDYYLKLDTLSNKFTFEMYKHRENIIDKVWTESQFRKTLQSDLLNITWLPGKILYNAYDSLHDKREIFLIDENTHSFYIRTLDNNYTKSLKSWDSVAFKGTLIDFFFDEGADKDFPEPSFVAIADSIKIITRKNK